jgi:hypothetical protein
MGGQVGSAPACYGSSLGSNPDIQYCGSGIRCFFDSWIRDPGWVKKHDPDPGFGSGINNPDHISESLETSFWVKILKFSDADPVSGNLLARDPGWKKFGSGVRDKRRRSATMVAKLVAGLLATAALWVRIQTSLKNTNGQHKQTSN